MKPPAANMPGPWHLGNDVIDLADPRALGKASEKRFLRRVFSEFEQEAINASHDPDLALWTRWTAKEAAFKSISKTTGEPPVFHHPSFLVTLHDLEASGETDVFADHPPLVLSGEVCYQGTALALRVQLAGDGIHALTWLRSAPGATPPFSWGWDRIEGDTEGWKDRLRGHFTEREWCCVSHRSSALTRLAARRALASALRVPQDHLEIGCDPGLPGRRIPRVFVRGRRTEVDLSLSHHGRFQAWAFTFTDPVSRHESALTTYRGFDQSQGR